MSRIDGVEREKPIWYQMGFSSQEEYDEALDMDMTDFVKISITKKKSKDEPDLSL